MTLRNLLSELRRRQVLRVGAAYILGAWVLVQVGDVLLPIFHAPDAALRVLTLSLALLFPIVVAVTWTFEWTSEGLVRDTGDVPAGTRRIRVRRKIDIAILVLALIVVGGLIASYDWDRELATGSGPTADAALDTRMIAVLPFRNTTGDVADLPLADGIAETLIHQLGLVSGLRVTARSSSFAFRDDAVDAKAIGARLGAASILEGSIQRSGDRLRIIAQLIDARTGVQLWTQQFDRRMSDIFAIQDEISQNVVAALNRALSAQLGLGGVSTGWRPSIEAYQSYLQGLRELGRGVPPSMDLAIQNFQKAIDLEPRYALAYVGLANTWLELEQMLPDEPGKLFPDAAEAIEKALKIDPNLGEAHAARGKLYYLQDDDEQAEAALARAIELNPNDAQAHLWYANVLIRRAGAGDENLLAKADAALQSAYVLDPLSVRINQKLGERAFDTGKPEVALRHMKNAAASEPDTTLYAVWAGNIYARNYARPDEAARWYRSAESSYMGNYATARLVGAYLDLLDVEAAEAASAAAVQDRLGVPWHLQLANLWIAEARFDDLEIAAIAEPLFENAPIDIVGFLARSEAERALLWLYLRQKRCDEALELYREQIDGMNEGDLHAIVYDLLWERALRFGHVGLRCTDDAWPEAMLESLLTHLEAAGGLPEYRGDPAKLGFEKALALSMLQRNEEALDALESSFAAGPRQHWSRLLDSRLDPRFDGIRNTKRFGALVERLSDDARKLRIALEKNPEVSTEDPGPPPLPP